MPDWDTLMWLAAAALTILRGRLQAYVSSSPAGSCTPANARMVRASDHHDALEVRRAGLLVAINSNCHALHGVRAEIAALREVLDTEPPEARAHLAGDVKLLEKYRDNIGARIIQSEELRNELWQWRTSTGLQTFIPYESSCRAFLRKSRMACDNVLYVTRTLSAKLARSQARRH